MTKLTIIIVSFNTKKLLVKCLNSLFQDLPQNSQVIVVDNASTDGSQQAVKKHFQTVKLISNKSNLGYAKANNLGIKQAKGQYILLLNSDTLVHKKSLTSLIDYLDQNPKVGITSPQLLNSDQTIQQNGGALPRLSNIAAWMWFLDDLPFFSMLLNPYHQQNPVFYQQTRPTGWVSGAALVIRRAAIDDVGMLDENIFMYSEDTDLCFRVSKAGWQVTTFAGSKITHVGHASGNKNLAITGEVRGLIYYFQKHKSNWETPLLRLILGSGTLLRHIIFGRILRDEKKAKTYRRAFDLV